MNILVTYTVLSLQGTDQDTDFVHTEYPKVQ